MNYLCLWLSLFGIFAFKNLKRSSLRFCVLACKSTQKEPTHKLKLIYRTTLKGNLICICWGQCCR